MLHVLTLHSNLEREVARLKREMAELIQLANQVHHFSFAEILS